MSWLDFLRKAAPSASASPEKERLEIPLFPLGGVLCPGGVLSLKVFEQRYLDMAAACMKNHTPFGVCLTIMVAGTTPEDERDFGVEGNG